MIPLASRLRDMNNKVFIGAGKEHLAFFRTEVPGLNYIDFPGFSPSYSRFLPQYITLFLKTPLLIYYIIRDHYRLETIVRKYSIDLVISDNRFGAWNKKITSVYITHMPVIPFPKFFRLFEKIGVILHRYIIRKYSCCFIPDLPGELNISGRLSHRVKLPENTKYIGILSRFADIKADSENNSGKPLHTSVILSGPEPQRSVLKKKLISILTRKGVPAGILEGRPGKPVKIIVQDNLIIYSHLPSAEMKNLLSRSESIITRPGYSTIMELISMKCSAVLVPTPGQTEQEYLAEYLSEKGWFTCIYQKDLNADIILPVRKAGFPDEIIEESRILLDDALTKLLQNCHREA